jgi:hypothetical protein
MRKNGKGHKQFEGNVLLQSWLKLMEALLTLYATDIPGVGLMAWQAVSMMVAQMHGCGKKKAASTRKWTRVFLKDCLHLPINLYGSCDTSLLQKGDLSAELQEHLLSVRKHAQHILHYLKKPEVCKKYSVKHTIGHNTACTWMKMMDYRWSKSKKGMYIDGHNCEDVLAHKWDVFLPALLKLLPDMQKFKQNDEWTKEPNDWPPKN